MTSHLINLTQLKWFSIITYPEFDFSFIIYHLLYLIFPINLFNQFFKPPYIKSMTLQTGYIRYIYIKKCIFI